MANMDGWLICNQSLREYGWSLGHSYNQPLNYATGGLIASPPPDMARLSTGPTEEDGRRKGVHRIGAGKAPVAGRLFVNLPVGARQTRLGRPIISTDEPPADEPPASGREPCGSAVVFREAFDTDLDELFIGARVCVRGRPQICGEIVQIMPEIEPGSSTN